VIPELHALVAGKRVAVVGNAQSLNSKTYGEEIDSHDIVIRMNHSAIYFVGDKRYDNEEWDLKNAVGSKIDVWAVWDTDNYHYWVSRKGANHPGVVPGPIAAPKMIDTLNGDDGVKVNVLDLGLGHVKMGKGFFWLPKGTPLKYQNPLAKKEFEDEYNKKYAIERALKHTLWRRFRNPSTGVTVLSILDAFGQNVKRKNRDQIQSVDIYGFDFKVTPTFSTPKEKIEMTEEGKRYCYFKHDWLVERDAVLKFCDDNKKWNLIE
jgi:hypothetical protein